MFGRDVTICMLLCAAVVCSCCVLLLCSLNCDPMTVLLCQVSTTIHADQSRHGRACPSNIGQQQHDFHNPVQAIRFSMGMPIFGDPISGGH